MSATPTNDALGLVGSVVDQIRFDACVDAGGFGTVYRGTRLANAEQVAIKCLRLSRLSNLTEKMRTSIVARFQEETKILHHLSHGTHDIVRCISSGQVFAPATGEPIPYMVLEWLDGRSLSADLAERRARGLRGRTLPETLDLVESATLAIAHAHSQGIIHRDIKPANLMLTRTRGGLRLKVLDFGLAKILSDEPGSSRNIATADGVQLFSVAYCAPEQLSSSVGETGPWTDIYSLALVMLEVMRGEKIQHPTKASLRASSLGIDVPAPVEDLLARAVSQNPLERPANANIFWSALRELTRRSAPPIADASALAATAFDGGVSDAMSRVRAMTAGAKISAPPTAHPNHNHPFTGTMLMTNAPSGALHLLSPHGDEATAPRPPSNAPVRIAEADGRSEPSTAPLARPLASNAVTAGLPPLPSPLASSLGPGFASPSNLPATPREANRSPARHEVAFVAPATGPSPLSPPAVTSLPSRSSSIPPPPPATSKQGAGLVVALLVVLVGIVALAAAWFHFMAG